MKKLLSTILISTMTLTTGMSACAQTLSADSLKELVSQQIKTDLKEYKIEEIQVNVGNPPVQEFEIPDGKVSVSVISNSNGLNPREYKKINISVNKKIVRTTFVQAEIKAFKNVIVAKEMIPRDKAVSMQSVEVKRVDVLKNINDTLSSEDLAKGLLARKSFYPGEIITGKYTATRPDILKDAIVAVTFKTDNNLTIIVEGIAMIQGNIGDTIQVKNKRLNRIYTGKVVGENKVLIQI